MLDDSVKETVQHVFFECVVAQKVWKWDSRIGIQSVRPICPASHFMNFNLVWCGKKANKKYVERYVDNNSIRDLETQE